MSDALFSLLSNSWSGLLIAGFVATLGWALARIAVSSGRPRGLFIGRAIYVVAGLLTIGSVVAIVRDVRVLNRYPPPGKLIDIGGYRLHLLAEGNAHGRPTLVWIPGGHASGFAFYGHHRIFREETRSILFDRAGAGWSDTGPFPRRTALEAEELATLLERAGERGPFVLVGHSYGGFLALNFARRYPQRVAGLVLLDAAQPDMTMYNRWVDGQDGFAMMARIHRQQGLQKLFGIRSDPFEELASRDPRIERLQRLHEEYMGDQRAALDSVDSRPATDWAAASLDEEFYPKYVEHSALQWLVYDDELGDLPLWVVLPRDEIEGLVQRSKADPERVRALRLFQRMQRRYLQASSRSHLLYAPADTGHNFPYETPEFVTDVVRNVLRDTASSLGRPTLFRDVNVISMTNDEVLPHRDVLVRDGRIARIGVTGSIEDATHAQVVDGQGRWLMPGLTEMHGHLPGPDKAQYAQDILTLFLAHGFTTVRSMLGNPWHLELRSRIARNDMLAPRLFTAGPSLNGQSAPDVATAVTMVRDQAAAGYDFLKLHPGLTVEVFDAIARTGEEQHITLQGHISEKVGVGHALGAKQRAIDHLDGYLEELANPECKANKDPGFFGIGILACVDESRIPALVQRTKAAGTWMVPTENLMEQWAHAPTAEPLRARPAVRYMPRDVVSRWLEFYRGTIEGQDLAAARLRKFIELRRAILREMHRQHVPIALGSDAPQIFNVPGDSALEELRLYAEIGLSSYDALKTATSAPAEFFQAADQFGTVREGLSADLILLQRNPLENVSALRALEGVMVRGRWLPRAELDEMLEAIAARAGE